MDTIIFPPGSTGADLQNAINNLNPNDQVTFIISSDMPVTQTINCFVQADITICSTTQNQFAIIAQPLFVGSILLTNSSITLQDIIIDGQNLAQGINSSLNLTLNSGAVIRNCVTTASGGAIYTQGGNLTLNDGAIIEQCSSMQSGGGVYVSSGNLIVNKATITNCICTGHSGGGLRINTGTSQFNGCTITNNQCEGGIGGGLSLGGTSTINDILLQSNTAYSGGGLSTNDTTINGGIIRLNSCQSQGGGIMANGKLTMLGGVIEQNSAQVEGGGINIGMADVKILGGKISYNTAQAGGGICSTSQLVLSDCEISFNTATWGDGGGIRNYSVPFPITNCVIANNTCTYNGGGLFSVQNGSYTISNTKFYSNYAGNSGGALFLGDDESDAQITNNCVFCSNCAVLEAGAIYWLSSHQQNLICDNSTVFSCNCVNTAHNPPANPQIDYPNIKFASCSVFDHVLNNYDINYSAGTPHMLQFKLTYSANGGSGEHIIDSLDPAQVLSVATPQSCNITREGYIFSHWNTASDDSLASYNPLEQIRISCNTTLYAQWIKNPEVDYNANGGLGYFNDHRQYADYYVILSPKDVNITNPNHIFVGYNTSAHGDGVWYQPNQIIYVDSTLTLFAQWIKQATNQNVCNKANTRTSVLCEVIWIDNDNAQNTRPSSITVTLLKNGESYKTKTTHTLSNTILTFCCLPLQNKTKTQITPNNYTVFMPTPPNYTTQITANTIINTLI